MGQLGYVVSLPSENKRFFFFANQDTLILGAEKKKSFQFFSHTTGKSDECSVGSGGGGGATADPAESLFFISLYSATLMFCSVHNG